MINYIKHLLVFALFVVIGCEVGGWILAQKLGGFAIGLIAGIPLAWPALVMASIYTEYVRKNK